MQRNWVPQLERPCCGCSMVIGRGLDFHWATALRSGCRGLRFSPARRSRHNKRGDPDGRKTPKIVEVPVGMEINMYACAARK